MNKCSLNFLYKSGLQKYIKFKITRKDILFKQNILLSGKNIALEDSHKSEHQHCHKTLDLQLVLLARCTRTMVAQNSWEWLIDGWFNLRLVPLEGGHALSSLDGQELETVVEI